MCARFFGGTVPECTDPPPVQPTLEELARQYKETVRSDERDKIIEVVAERLRPDDRDFWDAAAFLMEVARWHEPVVETNLLRRERAMAHLCRRALPSAHVVSFPCEGSDPDNRVLTQEFVTFLAREERAVRYVPSGADRKEKSGIDAFLYREWRIVQGKDRIQGPVANLDTLVNATINAEMMDRLEFKRVFPAIPILYERILEQLQINVPDLDHPIWTHLEIGRGLITMIEDHDLPRGADDLQQLNADVARMVALAGRVRRSLGVKSHLEREARVMQTLLSDVLSDSTWDFF